MKLTAIFSIILALAALGGFSSCSKNTAEAAHSNETAQEQPAKTESSGKNSNTSDETLNQVFQDAGEAIETVANAAKDAAQAFADSEAVQNAKDAVTSAAESVANSKAVQNAKEAVTSAADSVAKSKVVQTTKDAVSSAADTIANSEEAQAVKDAASDAAKSVKEGAKGLFGTIKDLASSSSEEESED